MGKTLILCYAYVGATLFNGLGIHLGAGDQFRHRDKFISFRSQSVNDFRQSFVGLATRITGMQQNDVSGMGFGENTFDNFIFPGIHPVAGIGVPLDGFMTETVGNLEDPFCQSPRSENGSDSVFCLWLFAKSGLLLKFECEFVLRCIGCSYHAGDHGFRFHTPCSQSV